MKDSAILAALERLGAAFPWDEVNIWIERSPRGAVCFTAYVRGDSARGTESIVACSETLAGATNEAIAKSPSHDVEANRERKIAELKEQLAKLEALDLRYPPYRPGTILAPGALAVDVEV